MTIDIGKKQKIITGEIHKENNLKKEMKIKLVGKNESHIKNGKNKKNLFSFKTLLVIIKWFELIKFTLLTH